MGHYLDMIKGSQYTNVTGFRSKGDDVLHSLEETVDIHSLTKYESYLNIHPVHSMKQHPDVICHTLLFSKVF